MSAAQAQAQAARIVVIGTPQPQGSKVRTQWGLRDDNPNAKPWQATVAAAASDVWDGRGLLAGAVAIEAKFVFARPKGHYGTGRNADTLKPSAPVWHTVKPDGDKLARAVGDALKGVVLRDDCVIAKWEIVKMYGHPARCELHVKEFA